MLRVRLFFPLLFLLAAAAAACGGGGGGSVLPSASPTPHAGPTSIPVGPTPQAVRLSGDGFTLSFSVPPVVTGATATMSATLQTGLPSGTIAPQTSKRNAAPVRTPFAPNIGANVKALVYLVVSTTATVGFSSAPSFQFTLPSGTTIPGGSSAYVLFWDPYLAGSTGWVALLGPGAISGQSVTFPSVQTGVSLNANTEYMYALAVTSQPVPTATPAPTPTPTVAPSSTPAQLPAYCSGYSTPAPNQNSAPQPVWFSDNSGTGAQVILYVVSGTDPSTPGSTQTQYLQANGSMTNFTTGARAVPIPLACFPGSTHQGNGLTFQLPPPTHAHQSENLYISYATPVPGNSSPPDPLQFIGASNGGNTQPTLDWNAAGYANVPFDYVEFTLPNGVTDVTQVDKVGLPLQITQGTQTKGFASGQYDMLLSDILADQTYSKLAVSTQLNGRSVLARILSPSNGEDWGFPQDWWYNSAFNGTYTAGGKGYVGYVLSHYKNAPRLYTLTGVAGESGNYCASSDGTTNVYFYSVGTATACSGLTSPSYTMNIASTLEGVSTGTDSYGVCPSAIFSMPYGGAGGPIADMTEFYLWKAMVIDIARGVALQNSTHPVGGWSTSPTTPPPFSDFYQDPVYNKYAYLVHKYMIGNDSYALQYDEPGGLAPTFTSNPSQPLQITVWNIPAYSRTLPTATATPLPCPT